MTSSLPPNLERIGRELDAAWRPVRKRPHPRAAILAGAVLSVVALALVLTVRLGDSGPKLSPLEQARAALAVPNEGVFHVRIEFQEDGRTTHVNEIWQSARSFRSTNTGKPESGGRADGTRELYDPDTQTIYAYRDGSVPPPSLLALAYTADMRRLLARPDAEVVGRETIEGIECVRIESRSVRGTLSTFYADAESYRPVLERSVSASGTSEVWFRVWEVLPEGPDSRRLSSLRLLHPQARLVIGVEEFRDAWARIQDQPAAPGGGRPEPAPPTPRARPASPRAGERGTG